MKKYRLILKFKIKGENELIIKESDYFYRLTSLNSISKKLVNEIKHDYGETKFKLYSQSFETYY